MMFAAVGVGSTESLNAASKKAASVVGSETHSLLVIHTGAYFVPRQSRVYILYKETHRDQDIICTVECVSF